MEDNIKMDLKDTGCQHVDWSHVIQDMVQWRGCLNTVMKQTRGISWIAEQLSASQEGLCSEHLFIYLVKILRAINLLAVCGNHS